MFRRLSTKLATLYAALFGVIVATASLAAYTAVERTAASMVRDELQANGAVFDRTWALRARQMQDSAGLLARDFGFRAAVATDDAATVRSALQNLQARLGIELAFMISADGRIASADGRDLGAAGAAVYRALQADDDPTGVLFLDGAPYQAVSAPVLSPVLAGWVVFAQKLDTREMRSLERLSAIPLTAAVLDRRPDGRWAAAAGVDPREAATVSRFVADALAAPSAEPRELAGASGKAIALVKPLKSVGGGAAVLLLRYPLAKAMAPFRPLVEALLAVGGLGLLVVVGGSFVLAGGVTRPITALDQAAQRLRRGEDATVSVSGGDEIARLAESFNRMAADIRDREARMRRDAETLAVALDRAEAANRTTNAFLANMSHEVRTPLNGVLGLTQVLAQMIKDPAQSEMIAAVMRSAGALERMLSDVLDAAKIGGGGAEIAVEPFEVAEVVRAAGAAWAERAAERGLALAIDVAPQVETTALGDPVRLRQILDALLSNAVKFTGAGEVRLDASASGGPQRPLYRFVVSDTGVGFDLAAKERLFQPFQQADVSSTRRHGGAGLGLSIARGLAELMGGSLDGSPRPEGGSVFVLELPLASADLPVRVRA